MPNAERIRVKTQRRKNLKKQIAPAAERVILAAHEIHRNEHHA